MSYDGHMCEPCDKTPHPAQEGLIIASHHRSCLLVFQRLIGDDPPEHIARLGVSKRQGCSPALLARA
jgi:hypothetical protein